MAGKYDSLIERLEGANGANRDLDAEVMAITHYEDDRYIGATWDDGSKAIDHVWVDRRTDKWRSTAAHRFTSSLDEAFAFKNDTLPTWTFSVDATVPEMGVDYVLYAPGAGETKGTCKAEGASDRSAHARALLAATLRALQAAA